MFSYCTLVFAPFVFIIETLGVGTPSINHTAITSPRLISSSSSEYRNPHISSSPHLTSPHLTYLPYSHNLPPGPSPSYPSPNPNLNPQISFLPPTTYPEHNFAFSLLEIQDPHGEQIQFLHSYSPRQHSLPNLILISISSPQIYHSTTIPPTPPHINPPPSTH